MNLKVMVLFGVLVIFLNLVAWQKDGVQVCTASGDQWDPKIATLDGGNTAICWQDGRIDTVKLYFQVLDLLGNSLFTKNGVKILNAKGTQIYQSMVSNGKDIFIAWENAPGITRENTDIFVTKVNGLTGLNEWGTVEVCTALGSQYTPQLCLDGSGEGCYVTWTDYRSGNADVWAARVTPQGQVAWEAPVCSLAQDQGTPVVVKSGDGCIIFWEDSRDSMPGIYGQRFTSDSPPGYWGANGKLIVPFHSSNILSYDQIPYSYPYAIEDGQGGAIVHNSLYNYLGQRVDSLGNLLWNPPPNISSPLYCFVSNKASGVIGCSGGYRVTNSGVSAVQIDSSGNLIWGQSLTVWTGPFDTTGFWTYPTLTDDSHHGAVVTWVESDYPENNLLITRVDTSGQVKWNPPRVICNLHSEKDHPFIINGPNQGYIVVWEDARNGNCDLYTQYIDSTGQVGINEAAGRAPILSEGLLSNEPNPFSQAIKIKYGIDSPDWVELTVFDVAGRKVKDLVKDKVEAGIHTARWDGRDGSGQKMPAGIYFCQLRISGEEKFTSMNKIVFLGKEAKW